jgi:Fic family protein
MMYLYRGFTMVFHPREPYNDLPPLPPSVDVETKTVLRRCISATRALAELKGAGDLVPNQAILINAIPLQEAKASSEVENILTTGDALYQAAAFPEGKIDPRTKEVLRYRAALKRGYDHLNKQPISVGLLREICEILLDGEVAIRSHSGTTIRNQSTGEVIYTPPDEYEVIMEKMDELERFMHNGAHLDPLICLALIHYQFEAIHPFEDGNGRTGRILNILYLVDRALLRIPVLYLSRFIIGHKNDYYRLLREVTEHQEWEGWILFILQAVEETATWTHERINAIHHLLDETTARCREDLPSHVYSRELVELIFVQPYCKIEFVVDAGISKRQTASEYLKKLEEIGILESRKVGREKIYVHTALLKLLMEP